MAATVKSFFKKNWLVLATMAITIGILTYFLITTDGIAAFGKIAKTLQIPWFLLMLAAVVGMWAMEGVSLHVIARRIYADRPLRYFLVVGMIGLLYGALTPFSTGGQPMQIYYMKKMGMDTGKAGAIIAVKTLVYQVVVVIFALVMVFWKLPYFQEQVSDFAFITIIGLATNLVFVVAVLFFAANQKATDKIMRGIIKLLHKMKLCKKPEERYQKIHDEFSLFYDSTRLMGRSLSVYLYTALFTIAQLLCTFFVPYLIYRSFNFHTAFPITMVAAQSFVTMVSAFVPLPGASGGAEGSFALYFQNFFLNDTLVPAIFVWRIATYYLTIAVGAVVAWVGGKFSPRKLSPSKAILKIQAAQSE